MNAIRAIVCAVALGLAPHATAQTVCPAGASTEVGYEDGAPVRLLAFHPDDPAAAEHAADVGVDGVVDRALQNGGECWFRGTFITADGRSITLAKAAVAEVPKAKAPGCPPGATRADIDEGVVVRVLDLHPDDFEYPRRREWVGRVGFMNYQHMNWGGCWKGASVDFTDGSHAFFFRAALQVVEDQVEAPRWLGAWVPKDSRLVIVGVDGTDALGVRLSELIGRQCVAAGVMFRIRPGWFKGPVRCDDGSEYTFTEVAVSLPDRRPDPDDPDWRDGPKLSAVGCPAGAEEWAPRPGTRMQVVGIGPGDPSAGDAATLVGQRGVVERAEWAGGCWMRGGLTTDDGRYLHFREVAYAAVDPPCPEGAERYLEADEGTWLELVGLHPDDAHADDAASWIGSRFIATDFLARTGACWHAGKVTDGDGVEVMFWKGAFRTLSDPCPTSAARTAPAKDDLVAILAIGRGDRYHYVRSKLYGKTGMIDVYSVWPDSCWMSGRFETPFPVDGFKVRYFFARVAVEVVGAPAGPRPYAASTMAPGEPVVVVDVYLFDANFSERDAVRSAASCVAKEPIVRADPGWYAGTVECDGTDYTFDKMKIGIPR